MAKHHVIDATGDTVHEFDPKNAAELAEAEKRFMELTGVGFTAAERMGPGQSRVVRTFDPTAEETLFVPRLRGG